MRSMDFVMVKEDIKTSFDIYTEGKMCLCIGSHKQKHALKQLSNSISYNCIHHMSMWTWKLSFVHFAKLFFWKSCIQYKQLLQCKESNMTYNICVLCFIITFEFGSWNKTPFCTYVIYSFVITNLHVYMLITPC